MAPSGGARLVRLSHSAHAPPRAGGFTEEKPRASGPALSSTLPGSLREDAEHLVAELSPMFPGIEPQEHLIEATHSYTSFKRSFDEATRVSCFSRSVSCRSRRRPSEVSRYVC